MSWFRRVFSSARHSFEAPTTSDESTRSELVVEQRRRAQEHLRTDNLAKIIADYRKQDSVLRRR